MTGADQMMALELESQTQLLTQIQLVTRFNSNLVQVLGAPGAGKTWMSERYLSSWVQAPLQSLLICHDTPAQDDARQRSILLRQLVGEQVFNAKDDLVNALDYVLKGQPIHAVIVVDNAQYLSRQMISELADLTLEAQRRDNWQMNILLFSHLRRFSKWSQRIAFGFQVRPIEFEVACLTPSERENFIETLLAHRQCANIERKTFDHVLSMPGALLAAAVPPSSEQKSNHHKSLLPMMAASVSGFLMLCMLTWIFVIDSDPAPVSAQPGSITQMSKVPLSQRPSLTQASVELPNAPALSQVSKPANANQTMTVNHQSLTSNHDDVSVEDEIEVKDRVNPPLEKNTLVATESQKQSHAQTDDFHLPNESVVEGMTVGHTDLPPRAVVSDQVVNAIMDAQDIGEDARQAVQKIVDVQHQEPSASAQSLPEKKGTLLREIPLANQILRQIPASRFALQLVALKSRAAVNKFVRDYDLAGKVFVYETQRGGKSLYMVVHGDYPDHATAKRAKRDLTQNVRQLAPWPKSFVQIHKEINQMR